MKTNKTIASKNMYKVACPTPGRSHAREALVFGQCENLTKEKTHTKMSKSLQSDRKPHQFLLVFM